MKTFHGHRLAVSLRETRLHLAERDGCFGRRLGGWAIACLLVASACAGEERSAGTTAVRTLAPAAATADGPIASPEPGWPQWRGPRRDGISDETGLLPTWPESGPKLLWTASGCGVGFSSAAIVNNTAYISGDIDGRSHVVAFDLDGKRKWKRPIGGAYRGQHPGMRSTPTVDGDSLYCLAGQGDLACIEAKTGRPRWSVNIIGRFRGRVPRW